MLPFLENCVTVVQEHYPLLLKGMGMTLRISLLGTAGGSLIGLLFGVYRALPNALSPALRIPQKILQWILGVYIALFKHTPLIVQAMIMHWGIATWTGGKPLPLFWSGVFILSLNSGAYISELLRTKLRPILQQTKTTENGELLQIPLKKQLLSFLPDALLSIGGRFADNIGATAVLNFIGVTELFFYAGVIKRQGQPLFESYLVIGILYFLMTFAVSGILKGIELWLCRRRKKAAAKTEPAVETIAEVATEAAMSDPDTAPVDAAESKTD